MLCVLALRLCLKILSLGASAVLPNDLLAPQRPVCFPLREVAHQAFGRGFVTTSARRALQSCVLP